MAYVNEMTWDRWAGMAASLAQHMINSLNNGLEQYLNWQTFRAGRTNAEIATALGKTEADIAALDAVYGAVKELYDYADNDSGVYQADRFYQFRIFS